MKHFLKNGLTFGTTATALEEVKHFLKNSLTFGTTVKALEEVNMFMEERRITVAGFYHETI